MTRRTVVFWALTTVAIVDLCVTAGKVFLAYLSEDPGAFFGWLGGGSITLVALIWLAAAANRHMDPLGALTVSRDADEHLAPLLTAHPTEDTITTDLRQRRMLLRPRGLSEHMAGILATVTEKRALRLRRMRHRDTEDVPGRPVLDETPGSGPAVPAGDPDAPRGGRHRGRRKGQRHLDDISTSCSGPEAIALSSGPGRDADHLPRDWDAPLPEAGQEHGNTPRQMVSPDDSEHPRTPANDDGPEQWWAQGQSTEPLAPDSPSLLFSDDNTIWRGLRELTAEGAEVKS